MRVEGAGWEFEGLGTWVAMPTGQTLRHLRIMMHPSEMSGAVEKPHSSAPSSIAMTTSRPVLICTHRFMSAVRTQNVSCHHSAPKKNRGSRQHKKRCAPSAPRGKQWRCIRPCNHTWIRAGCADGVREGARLGGKANMLCLSKTSLDIIHI